MYTIEKRNLSKNFRLDEGKVDKNFVVFTKEPGVNLLDMNCPEMIRKLEMR